MHCLSAEHCSVQQKPSVLKRSSDHAGFDRKETERVSAATQSFLSQMRIVVLSTASFKIESDNKKRGEKSSFFTFTPIWPAPFET